MLRYTVRRLLQLVLVLFVLSLLLFIWLRSLPGGPVSALLGERATPEKRAELDRGARPGPAGLRAVLQVPGPGAEGNFGQSTGVSPGHRRGRRVLHPVRRHRRAGRRRDDPRRWCSASRWATSPPGAAAASRTTGLVIASLIGIAVPVFFLAFLLKFVFAVRLGCCPPSGRQTAGIDATRVTGLFILDGLLTREWDAAWDSVRHLILPWIALGHHPVRGDLPDHPGLRAGGAGRGLRPHRRGERTDHQHHPQPARAAQRDAAGHHRDRAADRGAAGGCRC